MLLNNYIVCWKDNDLLSINDYVVIEIETVLCYDVEIATVQSVQMP